MNYCLEARKRTVGSSFRSLSGIVEHCMMRARHCSVRLRLLETFDADNAPSELLALELRHAIHALSC